MTAAPTLDVFHDARPAYDGRELIVDLFAGGGGASEGIKMALGREPDIAVNHDEEALALHETNHPATTHYQKNVWLVDPLDAVGHRPVGLLWMSPDCKHFSKAKGGRPVKRSIRDLAWVGIMWAKRARPRVILLENVEEFQDWGPVDHEGTPCTERKGKTFDHFIGQLKRLGYKVEWRELRACDYGAPTVRKRLFLIARRDGVKIKWPEPTHGAPDDPDVIAGKKKPWRVAAEIIDWSLPCPSIFLTPEEAKAIGCRRPLAEATMARIARGVKRYVLDNPKPFIVPMTHQGDTRVHSIDEPLRTVTGAHRGEQAVITPYFARTAHGDQDASGKRRGRGEHSVGEPIGTLTASRDHAVVAPYLVPRYGEREGQEPRALSIEEPLATIVPTANGGALVAPHLMTMRNAEKPFNGADEPTHTITAGGAHLHLVSAFLAQHNTDMVGHSAHEPVSTIVQKGCTQGVVAAHLLNLKGSDRRDQPIDEPAPAITAQGQHVAQVLAFMTKYYGAEVGQDQGASEPLDTITTKPRFGLITVMIEGQPYVIVDIGMRMLTPRELFRAQGFDEAYVIDRKPDGSPLTKTAQIRLCGNSVSPRVAAALVQANCPDLIEPERRIAA